MKTNDKIKNYASNISYAVKISFKVAPGLLILTSILFMIQSVLPYLPLFLWRYLLNGLVSVSSGEGVFSGKTVMTVAILYICSLIFQSLFSHIQLYFSYKYDTAVKEYMDNFSVKKLAKIKYSYFDNPEFQDKLSYAESAMWDIVDVSTIFKNVLYMVTRLVISGLLLFSSVWWIVPIVVLISLPRLFIAGKVRRKNDDHNKRFENSSRRRKYYFGLFFGKERLEIITYRLKEFFLSLYQKEWKSWHDADKKVERANFFLNFGSIMLYMIVEIGYYIYLGYKAIKRTLGIGDITYYVALMRGFSDCCMDIAGSVVDLKAVSDNLDYIKEFTDLINVDEESGDIVPNTDKIIFAFENVSFSYPGTQKHVLRNCSFIFEGHEKIGLIGANGSGKTTIIKLLLRLYEPTEGRITLNGVDIS